MNGILLLSLGATEYGQWARNMAVSLKYHNSLPITLVHDPKSVTGIDLNEQYNGARLFDKVVPMDKEDYTLEGRFAPGYAKTNLSKYTPYDITIYADVDGMCLQPLDSLLEKCKDKDFASHVWDYGKQGDTDWGVRMMWSKPENVWAHFGFNGTHSYPFLNSSLIVFTEKGKEVFERASRLMRDKPFPRRLFRITWGKANQPDELYFNAACAELGLRPDIGQHPIYFRAMKDNGKATVIGDIKDKYWFLGCWGDKQMNHPSVYKVYDQLMRQYMLKSGHTMAYNKAHQLMKKKFIKSN